MKNKTKEIFNNLIINYPLLSNELNNIIDCTKLLIETYKNGNKVLICGNGGSASDSLHMVGELMKSFSLKRSLPQSLKDKINDEYLANNLEVGLPTISLVSELALMTAYANDKVGDLVFAEQVLGYGKKGDTLICISTSGNSKNCVYASKLAKAIDMNVISLTGENDSMLMEYSNITVKAPSTVTFRIQEYHLPIYHAICLAIEEEMFGE